MECLIVPSAKGRCNKQYDVTPLQLAISLIAATNHMFFHNIAKIISLITIPNIETLDNPETILHESCLYKVQPNKLIPNFVSHKGYKLWYNNSIS